MQIESGVFFLKFQKDFVPTEFQFIRTHIRHTHTLARVRARTHGIEIFKIKELRGKVIKLLREEWLKIDKNIFVRNIPRCFPTSILQYSRRQFANIAL